MSRPYTIILEKYQSNKMAMAEEIYQKGRADGYSKAENDYFFQAKNDMENSYNCGYTVGAADERDKISEIIARMATCEVIDMQAYELIRNEIYGGNE